MTTTKIVRVFAAIGVALVTVSCESEPGTKGDSSRLGGVGKQGATADSVVFLGDSAETGDSLGVARGVIKLRAELGSVLIPDADLANRSWYALGDAVVTTTSMIGYNYLNPGQTFVLVRWNGSAWEAGLLAGATFTPMTMFVSATSTTATVPSARIVRVGGVIAPRRYACYTCDRKACCPINTVVSSSQMQGDVDNIATNWP